MGATLDRNKPFGNIYGLDEHGAVYTQGSKKFDAKGNECGPGINPVVASSSVAAAVAKNEPQIELPPAASQGTDPDSVVQLNPEDMTDEQRDREIADLAARLEALQTAATPQPVVQPSPVVAQPVVATPVAPQPTPEAPDARATLDAMHPAQIKKLVEEKGLTPATGAGSKNANIDQLLQALATE